MAGATVTRQRKNAPQQNKKAPARKPKMARAQEPSGAVIVLSGATPLRRQKAAEVLAEELQLDLASVDLSAVVSKHAGETEENVNRVFDMANRHGSILFFDEADALFGKRTQAHDAHDRYANAEVSHLIQCIEHHQGLVILTSNGKSRIEEAFSPEKPVIVLGGAPKKEAAPKPTAKTVSTPKKKVAKKK
ncbi:MAG: AAA family ATPase [Nitrospira sp.]|nr:AAA family ATPase [Nitrospira sp.]